MKMPKFVLRVACQEFVIPHNNGIAALMKLMEDAVPVHADINGPNPEIELQYTDDEDEFMVAALQKVSIQPIPRRTKWKRKTKAGEVVEVRPVEKPSKALVSAITKALKQANHTRPQLRNGSGPPRLTNGNDHPVPFVNAGRQVALLRNVRAAVGHGETQPDLL
jgi:hypothetical protein